MSKISEVLAKKDAKVATISPHGTVLQAATLMNDWHIGAVCVMEQDTLVGVFTERDLLTRVVTQQRDPSATKVGDVMTAPVVTGGPDGLTEACITVMSHRRIRHLPILDDGKLVGIVSTGDLMALAAEKDQAFIDDLMKYLHGRT